MNLHDIRLAEIVGHAWYYPVGANGQPIGRVNAHETRHVYIVERGTPPPIGATDRWGGNPRVWWTPYNRHPDPFTPLCGPLRTRARRPHLRTYNMGWDPRACPDCTQIAQERGLQPAETVRTLQITDPWTAIAQGDRHTTPDPLTGL